jgi:hypothetical protein
MVSMSYLKLPERLIGMWWREVMVVHLLLFLAIDMEVREGYEMRRDLCFQDGGN